MIYELSRLQILAVVSYQLLSQHKLRANAQLMSHKQTMM